MTDENYSIHTDPKLHDVTHDEQCVKRYWPISSRPCVCEKRAKGESEGEAMLGKALIWAMVIIGALAWMVLH